MIKKYVEYINELEENTFGKNTILISEEELEDQFLRLKEVLGCTIRFHITSAHSYSPNLITVRFWIDNDYANKMYLSEEDARKINQKLTDIKIDEITKELIQIKNRMEAMFIGLNVDITNFIDHKRKIEMFLYCVKITTK